MSERKAILRILEILKTYSDADNTLTHKDISKYLELDYGMFLERKTIRDNLSELAAMETKYIINYDERKRIKKDGTEEVVRTNWYYVHEFTEEELIYLIHTMQHSTSIPSIHRAEIIEKLEGLSNIHFRKKNQSERISSKSKTYSGSAGDDEERFINKEYLLNIATLDEAIKEEKKIAFNSSPYSKDKYYEKDIQTGSPYWIFPNWDQEVLYYCDDYDKKLKYTWIRRMYNIRILDEPIIPKRKAGWDNLYTYLTEFFVMSEEGELVTFRIDTKTYDESFKRVFYNHTLEDVDIDRKYATVTITAKVNEELMVFWALFYGIEIIEPVSYRKKVRRKMQELRDIYD